MSDDEKGQGDDEQRALPYYDGDVRIDGDSLEFLMRLLDTPAQALSFITLFCNAVHGDEGRFQTIHALDELQFRDDAVPSAEIESAILQGLTVSRSDTDDGWAAAGTVLYGDALFRTKFTLPLQGTLEMDDDEPVAEKLPIRRERWHRQFRLPPDDDSAGERP